MSGLSRLALAVAALAVALPSVGGDFVLDDGPAVVDSLCVTGPFRPGLIAARNFWCQAPGSETLDTWRPWVVAVWNLLWKLGAGAAWPFHVLGLLLHVGCTLQLAALGRELGTSSRAAWVGAGLFAVAPIHMDAVASVVGTADLWATLFLVLALRAQTRGSMLTVVWAMLAVLSKESGVVVLPALAAVTWLGPRAEPGRGRAWVPVAVAAGAVGVLLAARVAVLGSLTGTHVSASVNPLAIEPWLARVPSSLDLLWRYLRLLALGHPLSADYSYAAVPAGADVDLLGVGLGVLLAALAATWAIRRRADPTMRVLWLWFLAGMGLISNLVALLPAVFAERLFYGPSAPLLLLLGIPIAAHLQRAWVRVALAVHLLASAGLAAAHAWAWADESRITAVSVDHTPDSARAHVWRARVLARGGDAKGVEMHTRRAIEIVPTWAEPHALLAASLDLQAQPEPALFEFRRAFELDPREPEVADLFIQFLLRYGHVPQARLVYAEHAKARGGEAGPGVTRPP